MSSLSNLVFMVSVSTTISSYFWLVIAMFIVTSIVLTVIWMTTLFDASEVKTQEFVKLHYRSLKRWAVMSYSLLIASLAIWFLTPTRENAIYMAAAEIEHLDTKGLTPPEQQSLALLMIWINTEMAQNKRALEDSEIAHKNRLIDDERARKFDLDKRTVISQRVLDCYAKGGDRRSCE